MENERLSKQLRECREADLKKLRDNHRYSFQELANYFGISKAHAYKIYIKGRKVKSKKLNEIKK